MNHYPSPQQVATLEWGCPVCGSPEGECTTEPRGNQMAWRTTCGTCGARSGRGMNHVEEPRPLTALELAMADRFIERIREANPLIAAIFGH